MRGHFEAQLAAFDLVLDAATANTPISEAWLRTLYAQVTANQLTFRVQTDVGVQEHLLPHGEYKTLPNHVLQHDETVHHYAPLDATPTEVHRLIQELRTSDFGEAPPVVQAAYAHHALTVIHPFADGNGRTARALASVFLYRSAGVPLVIFSDQQERYWDALASADHGRPERFVDFIESRAIDTLAMVASRLREAQATGVPGSAGSF